MRGGGGARRELKEALGNSLNSLGSSEIASSSLLIPPTLHFCKELNPHFSQHHGVGFLGSEEHAENSHE